MSGIVGHSLYALLGLKAASQRLLPVAPIVARHWSSYLAGAYLGSDIQTMPEAICVDTGRAVGYGTVPLSESPLTGGAVQPWSLKVQEQAYRPRDIHELFYGRAHLVFGWAKADREHAIPWDHLPDYFARVVEDTVALFGPSERALAYVLGWIVHVVSDSLIKSVQPGIDLLLLDGKYTPRNRPIQDLISLHEVGIKELRLNWPALLADLTETPVEPVQLHYMRIAEPRGALAKAFANGWRPDLGSLLAAVLVENRRWCRSHALDVLEQLRLEQVQGRWECSAALREIVGMNYAEMLELADRAHFRHALWQMGEAVAAMFEAVTSRSPYLASQPPDAGPTWDELTNRWKRR
jgi:hypothetical protein